jgi:lysophospholipase L1-like esterase
MKKKKIGITIIGDSIIRYKKNNVIYDWPNELKKKISKKYGFKFYFTVKSVTGLNSKNLLALISKTFPKNIKEDIVLFQIGINDSWHYKSNKGLPCISENTFKKNLKKIYAKAKNKQYKRIIFLNYHKLLNNRLEINNKTLNENLNKYNKKLFNHF